MKLPFLHSERNGSVLENLFFHEILRDRDRDRDRARGAELRKLRGRRGKI